jgi:hypothetical protein
MDASLAERVVLALRERVEVLEEEEEEEEDKRLMTM